MGERSKHYGDVAKWIEKVIDSCKTSEQEESARKLIYNFETQYHQKLDYHLVHHTIAWDLIRKLDNKAFERMDKKLSEL